MCDPRKFNLVYSYFHVVKTMCIASYFTCDVRMMNAHLISPWTFSKKPCVAIVSKIKAQAGKSIKISQTKAYICKVNFGIFVFPFLISLILISLINKLTLSEYAGQCPSKKSFSSS